MKSNTTDESLCSEGDESLCSEGDESLCMRSEDDESLITRPVLTSYFDELKGKHRIRVSFRIDDNAAVDAKHPWRHLDEQMPREFLDWYFAVVG